MLAKLSKLPEANGVYLATESAPDSYTNPRFLTDHPFVLAALGVMPATGQVDAATMRRTFDLIWRDWSWKETWGWDFPMVSMTATRLGLPDKAVDALLMQRPTRARGFARANTAENLHSLNGMANRPRANAIV